MDNAIRTGPRGVVTPKGAPKGARAIQQYNLGLNQDVCAMAEYLLGDLSP